MSFEKNISRGKQTTVDSQRKTLLFSREKLTNLRVCVMTDEKNSLHAVRIYGRFAHDCRINRVFIRERRANVCARCDDALTLTYS